MKPMVDFFKSVEESSIEGCNSSLQNLLGEKIQVKMAESYFNIASTWLTGTDEEPTEVVEDIEEDESSDEMVESVIATLADIVEGNEDAIVTFTNNTSTFVTPNVATKLLEVWLSLNEENRAIFIDRLAEGHNSFNTMVEFSLKDK